MSRSANLSLGGLDPGIKIAKIQPDEAADPAERQIATPAHFPDSPGSYAEIFAGPVNVNEPLKL